MQQNSATLNQGISITQERHPQDVGVGLTTRRRYVVDIDEVKTHLFDEQGGYLTIEIDLSAPPSDVQGIVVEYEPMDIDEEFEDDDADSVADSVDYGDENNSDDTEDLLMSIAHHPMSSMSPDPR